MPACFRIRRSISICMSLLAAFATTAAIHAAQVDIPGPPGSSLFGFRVDVLPNGNIVVVDRNGPVSNIGAVHLLSADGALISTLTGSSADDRIGNGGIRVLPSGNFLVVSRDWDNTAAAAVDAGAVTWVDGSLGLSGQVSAANSLVGSTSDDGVGLGRIVVLANGNYVVASPGWNNGGALGAGAVTWGDGNSGISGPVSPSNSLVGTSLGDNVGFGLTALSNGHYVVGSSDWSNGALAMVGAVTWGNGAGGTVGPISTANSLVGSKSGDRIAENGVLALANGNYVVVTSSWSSSTLNAVGAVTWGDGTGGTIGVVGTSNSLVGRSANDRIGSSVYALANGNYVVLSPLLDNAAIQDAGAITLAAGNGPVVGQVGVSNSLVGASAFDRLGFESAAFAPAFVELANGNFVVRSLYWDNGATADVGAVTWINGTTGATGIVSPTNSLVGTTSGDQLGSGGLTALVNGHYVVASPDWNNGGATDAGAVTWASGAGTTVGPVSIVNSLIGAVSGDRVGDFRALALANGDYVVRSSLWDNGAIADAGAITLCNGSTGTTGLVSASNSFAGTSAGDRVGYSPNGPGVFALANGNFVVASPLWDDGASADVGAVTWIDGSTGLIGNVSAANSLIGSTALDQVGRRAFVYDDDYFAIVSSLWDDGVTTDAGAVTLASGTAPITGTINATNSLLGSISGSFAPALAHDVVRHRLAVGQSSVNLLSLLSLEPADRLFFDGFD